MKGLQEPESKVDISSQDQAEWPRREVCSSLSWGKYILRLGKIYWIFLTCFGDFLWLYLFWQFGFIFVSWFLEGTRVPCHLKSWSYVQALGCSNGQHLVYIFPHCFLLFSTLLHLLILQGMLYLFLRFRSNQCCDLFLWPPILLRSVCKVVFFSF